jgi:hypothetical protein
VDHTILTSALFGGLVAIGATVAIERLGGRLGGLVGSLPSTIIPASIGFYLMQGHAVPFSQEAQDAFHNALYAVPAGMLVNAVFLYSWRVLPQRFQRGRVWRRLILMSVASLLVWFLLAALVVLLLRAQPLAMVAVGWFLLAVQVGFGVWACRDNPPSPKGKRRVPIWVLLSRGFLAGIAIGTSVWIASLGVPFMAGLASIFPAIFLTSMVSVWLAQGEAVQAGAVGPMMLGSSAVSAYALAAAPLMTAVGPIWGTLGAWFAAVGLVSVPVWLWIRP